MNKATLESNSTHDILVVDDVSRWRNRIKNLVKLACPAAQVQLAGSYEEAKRALASEIAWSLVVTDVALARNDTVGLGLSVLDDALDRGLPAIVVSVTKNIGARGAQAANDRGARYFNKMELSDSDDTKRKFIRLVEECLVSTRRPDLIRVFLSYSREDAELCQTLQGHLAELKREKEIDVWYDRQVVPGADWRTELDHQLENASLILLLVTHNFIDSDFCYDVEMKRAIERHDAEEARVIPIILQPCSWDKTPFAKLQALPADGRPVTSWPDTNVAFVDVAEGIRQAILAWKSRSEATTKTKIP